MKSAIKAARRKDIKDIKRGTTMNEQNTNQALRIIRYYLFKSTTRQSISQAINDLDRAYDMMTDLRRKISRERSVLKQKLKQNDKF